MKLIHFTAPNGRQIGINPDQIEDVREPGVGEFGPETKAVIMLVSGFQAVRETRAEVERRLESA